MSKRKEYIQILSVLSCLCVVVLHINNCFWNFSYRPYWLSANIIECVCYFPVPIFMMISGVTLIDYRDRYTTKDYFKKRFLKTGIPFVIWTFVGIIFMFFMGEYTWKDFNIAFFVSAFINTDIISIYWFFIPLFAVYLSIPFLSFIPKDTRKQAFTYAALFAFITVSFIPFICHLCNIKVNGFTEIPIASAYIIYVLLGYLIDRYEIKKEIRILIYGLGILGLMMHIVGTYFTSYQIGEVCRLYKGYLNVPCVLYSTSVFVFFKYLKHEKIKNFLFHITKPFASVTFGVYLIHWYFRFYILNYSNIPSTSMAYRIFGPFIIFLLCASIVKIIQKIPLLNKILPS